MCAIAGEINFSGKLKRCNYHTEMLNVLKRRGPDQDDIKSDQNSVLIHTRLCVIDIEKGRQPMTFNELTIVYNGELYNADELRSELIRDGYNFDGHSDTEVLLKGYHNWGSRVLDKLNGIFAFAIYNNKSEELFFARDMIGVKPLFYTFANNGFVFASEIKALLKHPAVRPEIDRNSIAEIMLIGPARTMGYGIFKGIHEVKPGYYGTYSKNGFELVRYFRVTDKKYEKTFSQTVEDTRNIVTDAIERQLVSDVPLCTFLSGGLDSSIITAVAADRYKQHGKTLETFSVDYVDNGKYFKKSKFQPNSDDEYIDIMSKYLGTRHTKIILDTNQLVDALFKSVDARDLPAFADIDASMLLFCREVKKHATVALSGECADEIFGGYPWFRDENIAKSKGFPWAQSTDYRASFIKDDYKIDAEKYVNDKYMMTLSDTSKVEGLSENESKMKEMINLNMDWFMQTLLDRKDRMSMYSGLEVRVPFCDKRISQMMYEVPWQYKNYRGREKGLLRLAMQDYLPECIAWRKKSPYPKTHNPAFLQEVSDILYDIINTSNAPILDFVRKDKLEELLVTERNEPWYGQLMTTPQTIAYFIQINYWLEKYNVEITE